MNLGGRLRYARETRRLTQEQLAEKASTASTAISQAAISALESRDSESSTFLFQLARALEVSAEWLQTGAGNSGLEPVKDKLHSAGKHELSRVSERTAHDEKRAQRARNKRQVKKT